MACTITALCWVHRLAGQAGASRSLAACTQRACQGLAPACTWRGRRQGGTGFEGGRGYSERALGARGSVWQGFQAVGDVLGRRTCEVWVLLALVQVQERTGMAQGGVLHHGRVCALMQSMKHGDRVALKDSTGGGFDWTLDATGGSRPATRRRGAAGKNDRPRTMAAQRKPPWGAAQGGYRSI